MPKKRRRPSAGKTTQRAARISITPTSPYRAGIVPAPVGDPGADLARSTGLPVLEYFDGKAWHVVGAISELSGPGAIELLRAPLRDAATGQAVRDGSRKGGKAKRKVTEPEAVLAHWNTIRAAEPILKVAEIDRATAKRFACAQRTVRRLRSGK